jgi:hypothetical protein
MTIKRISYTLLFLLSISALIIILFYPEQVVDPSFNNVSATSHVKQKPVSLIQPTANVKAVNTSVAPTEVSTNKQQSTPAPTTNSTPAPVQTAPQSCAPNATSQDPCKLGQCFGYPYGVCESCQTPNSCTGKDPNDETDPNANYYDLWGNEFTYNGTLIQYSSECADPISGAINTYNPSCTQ